jgi:hypothetical protein
VQFFPDTDIPAAQVKLEKQCADVKDTLVTELEAGLEVLIDIPEAEARYKVLRQGLDNRVKAARMWLGLKKDLAKNESETRLPEEEAAAVWAGYLKNIKEGKDKNPCSRNVEIQNLPNSAKLCLTAGCVGEGSLESADLEKEVDQVSWHLETVKDLTACLKRIAKELSSAKSSWQSELEKKEKRQAKEEIKKEKACAKQQADAVKPMLKSRTLGRRMAHLPAKL